ncbi:MAG: hypothetical protein K2N27_01660, partial [Ruminococcus sp.]|nr:hypothetical protein [Ruminococcus sp.]
SQQTDLSETNTTSVNVTNIPLLSTMTTQIVTSENTVISTTILNPVYSANSTETQTKPTETKAECLYETTQTILSTTTAFQINSTETNTVFCTQTTTISENTDREGGLYMKKLTSFFTSAVVLAASATPIIGHAEYNIDTSRYWPGEKAMFEKMDSGELDTDIDGNGVVDALDGYLLECYCFNRETPTDLKFNIPDDISNRIKVIADYNSDGEVDNDDTTSWVRHFIANRNLKAELFDYDYYVSEYVSETDESSISEAKRLFMSELYRNMEYLRAGYDVVSDMYQKGIIDLDANGNGQLDIGDAYDFYIYLNAGRAVMAFPTVSFVEVENVYISDDEWNYCDNVFETYASVVSKFKSPYSSTTASNDNFISYVMLCIVENIELKSEYFTEEYYMETYGENYYATPYSMIVSSYVKQAAGELGLKPNETEWLKFNTDDLYEFFDSYCGDVESGLRSAPDVNMDGVIDYMDYFASNIYFSDLISEKTADESILPAEIWQNIEQNCDFNGNGTSKDIYDILTVQLYVVKYVDRIDDFDDAYNKYVESLGRNSEISFNEISYEDNVNILSYFEMKSNAVYGDANEDGEVNIADATAIVQAIGNKDKYELSKQGEINADCYNTGDGVTCLDALAIQKLETNIINSLPYNESI